MARPSSSGLPAGKPREFERKSCGPPRNGSAVLAHKHPLAARFGRQPLRQMSADYPALIPALLGHSSQLVSKIGASRDSGLVEV